MPTTIPHLATMSRVNEERRGVYPFCAPCTATSEASEAWRAAETAGPMGSRFYGHRNVCKNCGSSVRTLYKTVLWFPVSKAGRFRIIPTGGPTPGHPDTMIYRAALVAACEVAEARGKRRDVQLTAAARQLLNGVDVPTGT